MQHTNDPRFAARVEEETAKLDAGQVRDMAHVLVTDHGDNAFAQTRYALEEAYADNDAALYALWEAIQTDVLDIGPTGVIYC